MRIYQMLPTLMRGDGVGNETLQIDKVLREAGVETHIYYVQKIGDGIDASIASHVSELPELTEEDVLLYHLSIASVLHKMLPQLKCHVVFRYHNITPPEFFSGYEPFAERDCREGLRQTEELKSIPELVLADSGFNKEQLVEMGYTCPIHVIPILMDLAEYDREPDREVYERMKDGVTNILFVGRVVPNKKQEDVIRAFCAYHRQYNPNSRLILVGGQMDKYVGELRAYRELLGLEEKDVIFTGGIPFPAILAYYRAADLFLCMSGHEGFCIPLVEAMHFGVPIVACDSSAVGDTLGDGGVLLRDRDAYICARVMDMILTDEELRKRIRQSQQKQLTRYDHMSVRNRLLDELQNRTMSAGKV